MQIEFCKASGMSICGWCDDEETVSKYCYKKAYPKYGLERAFIIKDTLLLAVSICGSSGGDTQYYCYSCAHKLLKDLQLFIEQNQNQ